MLPKPKICNYCEMKATAGNKLNLKETTKYNHIL